jgi:hypothetical protein
MDALPPTVSTLFIEECFSVEDERFVDALRAYSKQKWLAAFTERWKVDPRPWAQRQMFVYALKPFNAIGHQSVVKRLFKHADAQRNDELMAVFMAAFDCLVRRVRKQTQGWDRATRRAYPIVVLSNPRDVLQVNDPGQRPGGRPWSEAKLPARIPKNGRLFSYVTRYYLRRRAWRYFRYAAFQRPMEYPALVAGALAKYQPSDLLKGEHFLDSWSLMHACFGDHTGVNFNKAKARLVETQTFGNLTAAPMYSHLWRTKEGVTALLGLISQAQASAIRLWAMQCFRLMQPTVKLEITAEFVLPLLNAEDDLVQQFGAELIETAEGVEKWPLTLWLQLLGTRNLTALEAVTRQFTKHVTPDRLSVEQLVEITKRQAAPVSKLGLEYLTKKSLRPAELPLLLGLATTKCAATGADVTSFALRQLAVLPYATDHVMPFLDALLAEVRTAAWDWLVADPKQPAYSDALLYSQLAETPWDDLKVHLIDHLQRRVELPGNDDLSPVWTSVLLNVHRGNRAKQKAVRQISEALGRHPDRAATWLPVLAVAVRSVRPSEARAGIAAVVTATVRQPELVPLVARYLPELQLAPAS